MGLAEFILNNKEAILQEWDEFARTMPQRPGMDQKAIRNGAAEILQMVAENMCEAQTAEQQKTKSRSVTGRSAPDLSSTSASHAHVRHRQGYNLNEMVAEYRALRATVIRLWASEMGAKDARNFDELIRFNEAIDQSLVEAIAGFSDDLDKSRDLLLGTLGHDLRTPLGAVLMSAEAMLSYGNLDGFSSQAMNRIQRSTKHIQELVASLLDVTRLRLGGSIPLERKPTNLAELCRSVVDEASAAHPECGDIELRTEGDLHGNWDSTRLKQVLSNLTTNAIQHGAEHRPIILIARDEGEKVGVEVHNEGKPIPASAIKQIFEPMTQAGEQRGPGSMGLGLYIVRAVAEAHGGRASVESSEEEGTTFRVELPK